MVHSSRARERDRSYCSTSIDQVEAHSLESCQIYGASNLCIASRERKPLPTGLSASHDRCSLKSLQTAALTLGGGGSSIRQIISGIDRHQHKHRRCRYINIRSIQKLVSGYLQTLGPEVFISTQALGPEACFPTCTKATLPKSRLAVAPLAKSYHSSLDNGLFRANRSHAWPVGCIVSQPR